MAVLPAVGTVELVKCTKLVRNVGNFGIVKAMSELSSN